MTKPNKPYDTTPYLDPISGFLLLHFRSQSSDAPENIVYKNQFSKTYFTQVNLNIPITNIPDPK